MLQKVPALIGRALFSARAGLPNVAYETEAFRDVPTVMDFSSTSFELDGRLPERCTADGAGISPALFWDDVPPETRSLVLLVEDADSPTPRPLVHALGFCGMAESGSVAEGVLSRGDDPNWMLGRNSYFNNTWLPCDPPPGHGDHQYCFQLFALDRRVHNGFAMGRRAALEAMRGHVIAKAMIVGNYGREHRN